jgi:hypothetical protein
MNPSDDAHPRRDDRHAADDLDRTTDHPAQSSDEDPRLLAAVEEYMAALEAGRRPNRHDFLKRHPDIATELAACLDGLAFVHSAAADLAEELEVAEGAAAAAWAPSTRPSSSRSAAASR